MAIETMEHSLVSKTVAGALLSPNVLVIATDQNGQLRYVSSLGEQHLGLDKYSTPKHNIWDFLAETDEIWPLLNSDQEIKNHKVHLKSQITESGILPLTLTVPKVERPFYQIKEHVLIFEVTPAMDLRMNHHESIQNLTNIIKGSQRLQNNDRVEDPEFWYKGIEKFATLVRESLQGSVEALVARKPKSHEYIDFSSLVQKAAQPLLDKISVELNNDFTGDFLGDSKAIQALVSRILSQVNSGKINLSTTEVPFSGVQLLFKVEEPNVLSKLNLESDVSLKACRASITLISKQIILIHLPYFDYNS